MDANFWLQSWKKNDIGFHRSEANPLLVKYFNELSLVKSNRVFVPLCGKTLDIEWLLSNGYRVAGAELSELAIEELFLELELEPKISEVGEFKHYSEKKIDIFVGDIFGLSSNMIGPVDAIYDRAALVALPIEMRNRYSKHLTKMTHNAPQLLLCYEYDQNLMDGPPFSINKEEVNQHYGNSYDISLLLRSNVVGGLKGICMATENVWLLKNP